MTRDEGTPINLKIADIAPRVDSLGPFRQHRFVPQGCGLFRHPALQPKGGTHGEGVERALGRVPEIRVHAPLPPRLSVDAGTRARRAARHQRAQPPVSHRPPHPVLGQQVEAHVHGAARGPAARLPGDRTGGQRPRRHLLRQGHPHLRRFRRRERAGARRPPRRARPRGRPGRRRLRRRDAPRAPASRLPEAGAERRADHLRRRGAGAVGAPPGQVGGRDRLHPEGLPGDGDGHPPRLESSSRRHDGAPAAPAHAPRHGRGRGRAARLVRAHRRRGERGSLHPRADGTAASAGATSSGPTSASPSTATGPTSTASPASARRPRPWATTTAASSR